MENDKKGNMKMSTLYAEFRNFSIWDFEELGIDLNTIHKWEIKRDTLYIQRDENGKWEEFEGQTEWNHDYIKYPSLILYDDGNETEIENGQLSKPVKTKIGGAMI